MRFYVRGRRQPPAIIIVALIVWQARGIDDARARRAICLANVPGFAVGSLVARRGSLAGVAGSLGWPVVVLYAFFALAYAYFLWPDRAERRTTQAARPN